MDVLILLTGVVFLIGISLGATGYGGFVVPILLVTLLGMDVRSAVAHGLISFVLPGLVGAWLYSRRRRRPRWRLVLALCTGTVPGVLLGRLISLGVTERALQAVVASLIVLAGLSLLVRPRRRWPAGSTPARPLKVYVVAALAGLLAGIASVIAGVGGPLITVPILLATGLELTTAVGAALMNSVFTVVLGAGAMLGLAHLDWWALGAITGAQLFGIPLGVWLQGRIGSRLVPVIGVLSAASGIWLMVRTFTGGDQ